MNACFHKLKMQGICAGGYWEPFATRGEVGRDQIKERLQNSLKCKAPFNNVTYEDGIEIHLPTIWFARHCKNMADSLRHWRLESWVSNKQLTIRDKKEKPAERWSHFCTALEGVFKDKRFRPRRVRSNARQMYDRFQGRR